MRLSNLPHPRLIAGHVVAARLYSRRGSISSTDDRGLGGDDARPDETADEVQGTSPAD